MHGSNYVNQKLVHNKVGVITRNLSQIPFFHVFYQSRSPLQNNYNYSIRDCWI